MQLRQFTPRGLYPRSILIAVVPVVLLLAAVAFLFYDSHWRQTSRKLSQAIASNVAMTIAIRESHPQSFGQLMSDTRDHLRMEVTFRPGEGLPDYQERSIFTPLDNILTHELGVRLDRPYWIDVTGYSDQVDIRVAVDGGVLQFRPERDRTFSTTGHIFIVWALGATLLLVALSLGFLRNQVRSILNLTEAAKAFGNGRDMPDFRPYGAREIREAARAVITMKNRLTAFAEQRTAMLAGVSHDLRTPLTRLKLQLAMMDETEDVIAARADLQDMTAMLEEYLAFARGAEGEAVDPLALNDLIEEIVEGAQTDALHFQCPPSKDVVIEGRRLALKRALSNLIGNALAYGQTGYIALQDGPHFAEIIVDDDGPGIPPEHYEQAFKPFARLNTARSQNVPGTGLGLALCRDTARAHGGSINLEPSPKGGLRARFRLPK